MTAHPCPGYDLRNWSPVKESCCRQYASTLRDIDRAAGAKPASSAAEDASKEKTGLATLPTKFVNLSLFISHLSAFCACLFLTVPPYVSVWYPS